MRHPIVVTRWGKTIDTTNLKGLKLNWVVYEKVMPYISAKTAREMMNKLK